MFYMKTAVYPGTFDPLTYGHLDIIKRSLKIFDNLVVVGENSDKKGLFSLKERQEMIKASIEGMNVEVDSFSGLLVDYLKKKGEKTVVRGIRALTDFEYEFQMNVVNKKLNEEMDTVFFMTDKKYFYLSSSIVKEIAKHKGELSCFVPRIVEEGLRKKFK